MKITVPETKNLLRIAWPLVMSSLINMGISITDVIMTGWLGPLQLAATAAASDFYSIVYYFVIGVISALSPIISHALGSNSRKTVRHATQQAFWVAVILCIPASQIVWHSDYLLSLLRVKPEITATALPYSHMMSLTLCFMLFSMVWHNFLSAHKQTQIIFRTVLVILPLNAVLNYIFMYGKFGLPEMGVEGVGLSSTVCAATMFVIFSSYILMHKQHRRYHLHRGWLRFYPATLKTLFRIGLPIGVTNLAELGIFLFSTVIMATISVEALAAHTVALRMAGVIYALPFGLAQAAAIRTAFSVGAKDPYTLQSTAYSAYFLALAVGLGYLILLPLFSDEITRLFLDPRRVMDSTLAQTTLFITIMAISQPLACAGAVAGGVLRGLKDTRAAMVISVISYWGVGAIIAVGLILIYDLGGAGIWVGLALGESIVGIIFTLRLLWHKRNLRRFIPVSARAAA